MKNLFICFFAFLQISSYSQPPTEQALNSLQGYSQPCKNQDLKAFVVDFEYSYDGNEGVNVLNVDCPELTEIDISILFNCYKSGNFCAQLFANGYPVGEPYDLDGFGKVTDINLNGNELGSNSQLNNWNTDSGGIIFTVDIINKIPFFPDLSTLDYTVNNGYLDLIENGDSYEVSSYLDQQSSPIYCVLTPPESREICCCSDIVPCGTTTYTIRMDFQTSTSQSSNFSSTYSLGLTVGAKLDGKGTPIQGSANVGMNQNYSYEIKKTKSISSLIRVESQLSNNLVDQCFSIGYQLRENIYEVRRYQANCDGEDIDLGFVGTYLEPDLNSIEFVPCGVHDIDMNDCAPYEIHIKKEFHASTNSDCAEILSIEVIGADISDLSIEWEDHEGNLYYGANIGEVPYGIYNVKVWDQCCQLKEATYKLCDSTTPQSPWQYNESTSEWCRIIDCECDPVTTSSRHSTKSYSPIEECVIADDILSEYHEKECIEQHFYLGEYLGEIISGEAQFETNYNENHNECVYSYYCQEDIIEEVIYSDPDDFKLEEFDEAFEKCIVSVECNDTWFDEVLEIDPEDYEWEFDDDDYTCVLNVQCMGEWIETDIEIEAEIKWNWDDDDNECISNWIKCDGEEIDEEIADDDYDEGDWEWFSSNCTRTVYCNEGDISFTDIGDVNFVETDQQDEDCNGNHEYFIVECDGEEVDFVCSDVLFAPIDETTTRSSFHSGSHLTQNNQSLTISIDDFDNQVTSISASIRSIDGRLVSYSSSKNSILEIDTSPIISGIYIVTVFINNHILETKKLLIH